MTKDHAKQESESHLQAIREKRKGARVMAKNHAKQESESHLEAIREKRKGARVMTKNHAKQESESHLEAIGCLMVFTIVLYLTALSVLRCGGHVPPLQGWGSVLGL